MIMLPENRKKILSVSELTKEIRLMLEQGFGMIWVSGEISNMRVAPSGHMYFTLKDENSQIRAVIFRARARYLPQTKDGDQVILRGTLNVYEARGEYQIIGEYLELSGMGNLRLAFENLKEKLDREGLFDAARKKTLPLFPKKLGIITSPTGAAIQDILNVVSRRFPPARIVIFPSLVQGGEAPPMLIRGIEYFNGMENPPDVILITRGGGSLEDLWAFNDENLARAIYYSVIPVVSAVGHEIDFTISDFVADVRSPTPSAAIEMIYPDIRNVEATINILTNRLCNEWKKSQEKRRLLLHSARSRVLSFHPQKIINQHFQRLDNLEVLLRLHMQKVIKDRRIRLENQSSLLRACNPENILKRGYAVCRKISTNEVVTNSSDVTVQEKLSIKLYKGSLNCGVEEIIQE